MHPTSTAAGAFPRLSMATFALILSLGGLVAGRSGWAATSQRRLPVVGEGLGPLFRRRYRGRDV